jgi:hypothetical protein
MEAVQSRGRIQAQTFQAILKSHSQAELSKGFGNLLGSCPRPEESDGIYLRTWAPSFSRSPAFPTVALEAGGRVTEGPLASG